MPDTADKIAFVTGASRGIGAVVARMLAERGTDIIINYRSKGQRAEAVAAGIQVLGRRAMLAQGDITDAHAMQLVCDGVRYAFGRIDILILNASGGLEKNKDENYPMLLNRDAQVHAVRLFAPLMPPGSRIVFVTSHWAHFYGEKPVSGGYEPVAASKKAGEDALRAIIPTLEKSGITLVVVSGDVIEGTITPKLLDRAEPGLLAERRDQVGALPTIEEFAQAIVQAAYDPAVQSGDTVFVGAIE
jgi:NAD(P)-dependent dehydrogenase (short-subunit alcohol dehydrogenase family)